MGGEPAGEVIPPEENGSPLEAVRQLILARRPEMVLYAVELAVLLPRASGATSIWLVYYATLLLLAPMLVLLE